MYSPEFNTKQLELRARWHTIAADLDRRYANQPSESEIERLDAAYGYLDKAAPILRKRHPSDEELEMAREFLRIAEEF